MSSAELKLCRSCGSDITSEHTERCPYCTAKLKTPTSKYYSSPDYLSLQRDSLLKELESRKLKPGDTKYEEAAADIQNEMVKWARNCPDEDRIAALVDSVIILRELVHSESSTDTMRRVIACAKGLSQLASTIEDYFKLGGSQYDREIRLVSPEYRDDGGNQAASGAGGGVPGRDPL